MSTDDTGFSKRFGYSAADKPITLREDSPADLRFAVAELAREQNLSPHEQRSIVCRILLTAPNPNNWSAYPNVWGEVQDLLSSCEWYKVYDIIEAYHAALSKVSLFDDDPGEKFEKEINEFFRDRGLGWQLQSGKIVVRGSEAFSAVTSSAADELATHKRPTAANELHEALSDLSRRPKPDVTGAIQHAMAAIECVARELSGSDLTLGKVIQKHGQQLGLPQPLDQALEKLWGYASQEGRHLSEGRDPVSKRQS